MFFFFKQKTAYEMRISDWSSDVCSSDLESERVMDVILPLLMAATAWLMIRVRYQRGRIALLGRHLADLKLESHMETLTQGYTRAINEPSESRQFHVLETFAQTERIVAAQVQALAKSMQKEDLQADRLCSLSFGVRSAERRVGQEC